MMSLTFFPDPSQEIKAFVALIRSNIHICRTIAHSIGKFDQMLFVRELILLLVKRKEEGRKWSRNCNIVHDHIGTTTGNRRNTRHTLSGRAK